MNRNEMIMTNICLWVAFPELDKVTIADFWSKYSWSFLQGLAKALYSADILNEILIRKTWYKEIEKHYDILLKIENEKWN